MKIFLGDRSHLAMLAIPVILSGILVLPDDLVFEKNILEERERIVQEIEGLRESDEKRMTQSSIKDSRSSPNTPGHEAEYKRQLLIRDAVEKNDRETFLKITADTPLGDFMTEEAFDVLVEEYQLNKKGLLPLLTTTAVGAHQGDGVLDT